MKTTFSFFLILFFTILTTSAQEMKVKYGKVSPEDLAMKVYPPDTEAVAVILSNVGRIQYDVLQDQYPLSEERHVVIKILKEDGIDEYGNAEIKYYAHNDYSKIGNIKAIVHLPDGTDIKVDHTQMYDQQINDYWSTKKITFPNLVPGAIIEYSYVILSYGMYQPVDWYFEDRIPVNYVELRTKIPDWFEYVILTQGKPLDKKASENSLEGINTSNINRPDFSTSGGTKKTTIIQNTAQINFIINTYINKDVPGLKEECCITTMEDYYSRVRYQLKAVQYPNSTRVPIMNSWQELAKKLYEYPEWGGQFRNKRPGELVLEAASINLASTATQLETAQKIYDYINQHIQWNKFYGSTSTRDINTLLKEKSGNSGDLNKMMCAALLQAGITAKPVLISTRDNGKPLELYPFTDQFNHYGRPCYH
jgi:hypothetical protein